MFLGRQCCKYPEEKSLEYRVPAEFRLQLKIQILLPLLRV